MSSKYSRLIGLLFIVVLLVSCAQADSPYSDRSGLPSSYWSGAHWNGAYAAAPSGNEPVLTVMTHDSFSVTEGHRPPVRTGEPGQADLCKKR